MNKNKKLKAFVLSLGLGMAMLATPSVQAQPTLNLLEEYYEELDQNNNSHGLLNMQSSSVSVENDNFTIADFVESTTSPLGSGIAILIGAGLGYVALKKKEDAQ